MTLSKKNIFVSLFLKNGLTIEEKPRMIFTIMFNLLVVKLHSNTSLTIANNFCIHFIQNFVFDLYMFFNGYDVICFMVLIKPLHTGFIKLESWDHT